MFSILYSPEVLPLVCSIRRKEASKRTVLLGHVVKPAKGDHVFEPAGNALTAAEMASIADFVRDRNNGKANR